MIEQQIKYRGSYSFNNQTKQGYYVLFDFIKNTSFERVLLNNTSQEELIKEFGKAQKAYYTEYPRFLPKGINISNDMNFNFQLHLLRLYGEPIQMGKYLTVQEAILAKKTIIALNIE